MARIGHIAIRSRDSRKAAEFFKQAFGFREIGQPRPRAADAPPPPSVGLTDGRINLTFLTVPADNVGCPEDFFGIQHIGFIIDDVEDYTKKLEALGAPCIIGWDKLPPGAHLEIKFKGPDGVIFDISGSPWPGTPGHQPPGARAAKPTKAPVRRKAATHKRSPARAVAPRARPAARRKAARRRAA